MFTVCTTPPPVKKPGVVQRLKPAKSNIYARPRAGLFFCLASANGAWFLFCPAAIQSHTSVYSSFSVVHAIIQPKRQNRLQGFTVAFPLIRQIPAHTIQQPHKSPIHQLCHVRGHTVKRSIFIDTQIQPTQRTLYRARQPPIIIMYIGVRRCALLRIHARRCSIAQTMPAAAGQCIRLASGVGVNPATIWHTPPSGGAVQQQGQRADPTAGGRRNHWRLPPYLFSGFRPITNRGQQ